MRLADRQGMFQGRRLSRVQRFALEILSILDARRDARTRAREFDESIKRALLTHNPQSMETLWPEWFATPKTTTPLTELDDIDEALESLAPATWIMPDTPITAEEAMRMIEEMSRQTSLTLTPADLDDDTGWT